MPPPDPRPARAVLHLTSAVGGGADRYLRDLAATTRYRHLAWHAGDRIDVVEDLAHRIFWPVQAAADRIAAWLAHEGIGVVHLHGTEAACLDRLAALAPLAAPVIVTLHDVGFRHPQPFGDSEIFAPSAPAPEAARVLASAAAVVAPSRYIAGLAHDFVPANALHVVAPGIRPWRPAPAHSPPDDFLAHATDGVVVVVGAIGPHKGSALLVPLAAALATHRIALVVLGYTDTRRERGWVVPGQLYVHGAFADDDLGALLSAYAPRLALFPNRWPESFSYTLSEVWAAGIPALVPDEGALGGRVRDHGGGWCLPAGFDAREAARRIVELTGPEGAAERARVQSTLRIDSPDRIPPLDPMSRSFDALYARFGAQRESPEHSGAPLGAPPPSMQDLLAVHLDGFAFRHELAHMTEDLANVRRELEAARTWSQKLAGDVDAAQSWARKLDDDVAALRAEHDATAREHAQELERLRPQAAAFERLPAPLRHLLLRMAARGRR